MDIVPWTYEPHAAGSMSRRGAVSVQVSFVLALNGGDGPYPGLSLRVPGMAERLDTREQGGWPSLGQSFQS